MIIVFSCFVICPMEREHIWYATVESRPSNELILITDTLNFVWSVLGLNSGLFT
jgi:hypothetical protein